MIWFALGAAMAVLQNLLHSKTRMWIAQGNEPRWIHGTIVSGLLGAAIYGTILWLIFG